MPIMVMIRAKGIESAAEFLEDSAEPRVRAKGTASEAIRRADFPVEVRPMAEREGRLHPDLLVLFTVRLTCRFLWVDPVVESGTSVKPLPVVELWK